MKDLLSLIESWPYALWAAGLGCAFFYVVAKGSAHLSDDNKARLSLYLQGDAIGTWAENFCALFDTVFGERHFSLKTFLRSAIASVLAVLALYVLLGPILGHLGTRSGETIPWLQVLAIGAAINILPDYLSLWETRWMLQVFRKVRNPILQFGVLVLDVVISGAIIWGGVTAYRLAVGEAPIPLIEMAAIYSPYAIFFYSTFLTSLLAWIYWITSAFVKAFTGLGLHRFFNVSDKRAGITLGLTGGIAFFGLAMAAQPFAKMEDGHLDAQLCKWFPAVACLHAERLTEDEQRKLDFLTKACEAGWEDCSDEASSRYGVKDEEAVRLWKSSCEAGSVESCANLGWMYQDGRGTDQDLKAAYRLARLGCDEGLAFACNNLGVMYDNALGVSQDYGKAVALYQQGCDGGNARGCTNLGFMYDKALGVAQDYEKAVALYRQGCDGGAAGGCSNLGFMYREELGVARDFEKALALFTKGCEGGNGRGCTLLAWTFEKALGADQDLKKAETLYIQACEMGDEWACEKLETFREVPK